MSDTLTCQEVPRKVKTQTNFAKKEDMANNDLEVVIEEAAKTLTAPLVKSNLKNKKPPRHPSVDSKKRVTFPTLSISDANQGGKTADQTTAMATTAETLPKPAKQRPSSANKMSSKSKKGGKVVQKMPAEETKAPEKKKDITELADE